MPTIDTDYGSNYIGRLNTGDNGYSSSGAALEMTENGSDYSTGDYGEARATCAFAYGGFLGSSTFWSYVGSRFNVFGSDGRAGAVSPARLYVLGNCTAGGGGSYDLEISIIVRNHTRGYSNKSTIYHSSGGGADQDIIDEYMDGSVRAMFYPGEEYSVVIRVDASASLTLSGIASADVGPFDGDGGYLEVDGFSFDLD